MTGIKACEEPPDNGGERTALKTENDSPQETEEPLRSLCLGYSGEMESCSFVRQEQGSAVKGRTGGPPAREPEGTCLAGVRRSREQDSARVPDTWDRLWVHPGPRLFSSWSVPAFPIPDSLPTAKGAAATCEEWSYRKS